LVVKDELLDERPKGEEGRSNSSRI
jgi:hypothetical protein